MRVISFDPSYRDGLSQLVRGDLSPTIARSIVDPNYKTIPSLQEKTPVIEPESPIVEETLVIEPETPIVEETPVIEPETPIVEEKPVETETIEKVEETPEAIESLVVNAQEEFVKEYAFPSIQANALYENRYPLSTALARPCLVQGEFRHFSG